MRKSSQATEVAPRPFSNIDQTLSLASLFGCNPETALAAVDQFKGARHQHSVDVRTPGQGPERHREDMYRTFRANGEASVPAYVAEHFARVGRKPPQPEIIKEPDPVAEEEAQAPQLITDQWLHTFVKWHIEMEGICPHENSTSPVYFKLGENDWQKIGTSWAAINAKRLALSQTGVNEFVAAHGYEIMPARGPDLSPATNPISDHWLKTFAVWHFEKEGAYPSNRTTTPVYFKLQQAGQPDEWVETGLHWADLNDSRILGGQSSLNEFIEGISGSRAPSPASRNAGETLVAHHKKLPLTDARLKHLLEWHHEKEGRYPKSIATTPVWTKDAAGTWLKSNDSWHSIEIALARRGRGVETPATTLRKFLKLHGLLETANPERVAKPRTPRELKAVFSEAHVPVAPAPLIHAAEPELTTIYLDYLLDKFRAKTRQDPDCTQARERVWDQDHAGRWVELTFSWAKINQALTNRTHSVDSPALTLKGHIRRQLPEITPASVKSLLDLHQLQEKRPLKTDPVSLNQNVWMKTSEGQAYKSLIRWNLFAEHLKNPEAAARFGTQDFATFVRRQTSAATDRLKLQIV